MKTLATVLTLAATLAFAAPTVSQDGSDARPKAEKKEKQQKPDKKKTPKSGGGPRRNKQPGEVDVESIRKSLEEAVRAGKLTPEQARQRFESATRRSGVNKRVSRADALKEAATARVERDVKAGRLTREQGDAKLAQMLADIDRTEKERAKARARENRRRMQDAKLKAEWSKMESRVKAGKLTPEQAKKQFEELRKSMESKTRVKKKAGRSDRESESGKDAPAKKSSKKSSKK